MKAKTKTKIKFMVSILLVFGSLYGFKYMRDSGMVIPIDMKGILLIKSQIFGEVEGVAEFKEEVLKLTKGKEEEKIESHGIVGYKEVKKETSQVIKGKEVRLDNKKKSEEHRNKISVVSSKEVVKEVKRKILTEAMFLKEFNIELDYKYMPSYRYIKNCASCHGYHGTGYNNGKELLGGGIIQYNTETIYNKLVDYKRGELESVYMGKVLAKVGMVTMREFAKEMKKFRKK